MTWNGFSGMRCAYFVKASHESSTLSANLPRFNVIFRRMANGYDTSRVQSGYNRGHAVANGNDECKWNGHSRGAAGGGIGHK